MNDNTATGGVYVIDVMPILYRGHFVFLRNPRMTSTGVNTSALSVFISTISQIIEARKPSHVALAFESTIPTFRHTMYPEYKAQRDKMPEDLAASIPMASEFAAAMNLPAIHVDGYEADDVMGAVSAAAEKAGLPCYLVSPDKDIAQLVGGTTFLYHVGKGSPEVWGRAEVCEHWQVSDPLRIIDLLALEGDSSDNIPGIKGVGEKTAIGLLKDYGTLENLLAHAAELKGKLAEKVAGGAESARLSYDLATIRRDIPLPCPVKDLALRAPDRDALRAFCAKYEMNQAAKRLLGEDLAPSVTDGLPLFGTSAHPDPRALSREVPPSAEAASLATLATTPHDYACVIVQAPESDLAPHPDSQAPSCVPGGAGAPLASLAAALRAAPRWAFDTETTGLEPRHDRLVGLSFATAPGHAWYVGFPEDPAGRAEVVRHLAPLFADPSKVKIAHNAKFDMTVLARHGMPVAGPVHDTLLTHFVLDAAERHGMDALARSCLQYDPIPISTLIGEGRDADPARMGDLPPSAICDYAAEDADVTLRLHDHLRPLAEEAGLRRALEESEEPLIPVLIDMENEGVRIDPAALHAFGEELGSQIAALESKIVESAGEPFNLNSPKQLGEILYDKLQIDAKPPKTTTGQYVTNEQTLQRYAGRHPIVDQILEYRGLAKLKSTYADKLPECIDPATGRVHTHFSQAMTETGRLASSDPNLQNIPVRTDLGKRIRAAFVARDDDHVLLSADYSQIELRLMAALSGDAAMLDAFRHGADIHTETASRVYDVMPGLVTPEMRSRCKMVNFGIIYGISAFGLAQRLGIPRREAADLIDAYFRHYPGIRAYMEKAVADAREKGYAETVLGRRRYLRDISSRSATVRQAAERNAINTPVQGSAADLIKIAMVRVHRALSESGLRSKLVLQIHDELLLDVPREEEPQVRSLVHDAMVNALDFGVPLEVEIGSGRTWLEAH